MSGGDSHLSSTVGGTLEQDKNDDSMSHPDIGAGEETVEPNPAHNKNVGELSPVPVGSNGNDLPALPCQLGRTVAVLRAGGRLPDMAAVEQIGQIDVPMMQPEKDARAVEAGLPKPALVGANVNKDAKVLRVVQDNYNDSNNRVKAARKRNHWYAPSRGFPFPRRGRGRNVQAESDDDTDDEDFEENIFVTDSSDVDEEEDEEESMSDDESYACLVCKDEASFDPIGCINCKLIVGCRMCIDKRWSVEHEKVHGQQDEMLGYFKCQHCELPWNSKVEVENVLQLEN